MKSEKRIVLKLKPQEIPKFKDQGDKKELEKGTEGNEVGIKSEWTVP